MFWPVWLLLRGAELCRLMSAWLCAKVASFLRKRQSAIVPLYLHSVWKIGVHDEQCKPCTE
jgi:hypothetical protein